MAYNTILLNQVPAFFIQYISSIALHAYVQMCKKSNYLVDKSNVLAAPVKVWNIFEQVVHDFEQ